MCIVPALIGKAVGGRTGAIIGAGLGGGIPGAIGAALLTKKKPDQDAQPAAQSGAAVPSYGG